MQNLAEVNQILPGADGMLVLACEIVIIFLVLCIAFSFIDMLDS